MQGHQGIARKLFIICNYIFCFLVTILCLFPIVHILSLSFSSKNAILAGSVTLFPVEFTFDNYKYVMRDTNFFRAFGVGTIRTLMAVVIVMLLVVMSAYPLSLPKQKFSARPIYAWAFVVTSLFSGGLVPTYLVVAKTRLIDTIWALILPGAVPVFYIILMQNFMKELPESLSEAAEIDGAGYFRILFQIILPLCKASIATILLFVAVDHWNAWYDGMLYINDNMKFPLQTYLRTIVVKTDMRQMSDINSLAKMVASTGADTAKIFIAMVPILLVYPFVQKYFTAGIVLGSVKG